LIKQALEQQGIEPTAENIKKAKAQFEKANPKAVHIYKGKRKEWHGNKFLFANDVVKIPEFSI
jgi:predicted double-glycine peptidase